MTVTALTDAADVLLSFCPCPVCLFVSILSCDVTNMTGKCLVCMSVCETLTISVVSVWTVDRQTDKHNSVTADDWVTNTPGTRGGSGFCDQTLAAKAEDKTPENLLFL